MHPAVQVPKETGDGEQLKSGVTVGRNASTRLGFMPLPLDHVVLEGLRSIPVYLRTLAKNGTEYQFTLYSTPATRFAERHRERLKQAGVRFIYIRLANQMQFRRQVEEHLESAMADSAVAISTKSELVYETSVELVDELLMEQDLVHKMPRLQTIAKAVTTLVINDASAFSHLFAASQHDFYTATHMVNVGTWMVPLAYACGIRDMQELNELCVAGMLHDIGKIFVPEEILNKPGKLTDEDWSHLKAHPAMGFNHLRTFKHIPEIVMQVALQHHERLDGNGYPAKLCGEKITLASRICAIVDSFDAMTAFRPFKEHTMSFGRALSQLQDDCGVRYDKDVMDKWVGLMQRAEGDGAIPKLQTEGPPALGRRKHERFSINCPARVHAVEFEGERARECEGISVTAHNLSRSGLGFLSREAVPVSQHVRAYLLGMGTLSNRVIEGVIVRCREFSDGWHEVGLHMGSLEGEVRSARAAGRESSEFGVLNSEFRIQNSK